MTPPGPDSPPVHPFVLSEWSGRKFALLQKFRSSVQGVPRTTQTLSIFPPPTMARPKTKKGESGHSAAFISRSRAITRLQLSLSTFRRLCILKGIYPRDPPNKKKLIKVAPGKGGVDQTFYALKDIQYLAADPLVMKMREERAWTKRAGRWRAKGELSGKRLASKPTYTLDHLVRERYPTFSDALKDLDDALSMIRCLPPCQRSPTYPPARHPKSETTIPRSAPGFTKNFWLPSPPPTPLNPRSSPSVASTTVQSCVACPSPGSLPTKDASNYPRAWTLGSCSALWSGGWSSLGLSTLGCLPDWGGSIR